MTATRDKFGRPIVVVTGMGVVTSLGAGKADNWTRLTAGESGIRSITRFPTDGLKTTLAGTIDFVAVEPFSSTGLSEQLGVLVAEEAVAQAGIGTKGDFPGRCFSPFHLSKSSGRNGWNWDVRPERRRSTMTPCSASAAAEKFTAYHRRFLFGSVSDHLAETFGTKGSPISLSTACASGATAIQLGVEAIRRGEGGRGPVRRNRRLGQPGRHCPVFPAVGAVDPERAASGCVQTVLEESRRLCDGGRRRRTGA